MENYFDEIVIAWGRDTANAIAEIKAKIGNAFEMPQKNFLSHCAACGGNWTGMLCTGIEDISPELYNALPEDLGVDGETAFLNIISLLRYLGVTRD